jgi:uncharacterized OB-fold protein
MATTKAEVVEQKALRIPFRLSMEYEYALGAHAERFFGELRDHGRILGVRCPSCNRVYVPPRPVCGICYAETREWVPVSDEGSLVGCTVVELPFIDPMTGEQRPVPYGFAMVRLDGADTAMYHFLEETDPKRIHVGQRVKAVFRDQRTGSLLDIQHFRTLEEAR